MKSSIRRIMLKKRSELTKEYIHSASSSITKRFFSLDIVNSSKKIAFYLPKDNEVDTTGMIKRCLFEKKEVFVPVIVSLKLDSNQLVMSKLNTLDNLEKGLFGVNVPKVKQFVEDSPNIVVVPGVAFGLCMHRIGFGKGYYDRYLKTVNNAIKIGLCYSFQLLEHLPRHSHDVKMDLIITESEIIYPKKKKN